MSAEFVVPAKPWTEEKLKFMKQNASLLPNEVKVELGMAAAEQEAEKKEKPKKKAAKSKK